MLKRVAKDDRVDSEPLAERVEDTESTAGCAGVTALCFFVDELRLSLTINQSIFEVLVFTVYHNHTVGHSTVTVISTLNPFVRTLGLN